MHQRLAQSEVEDYGLATARFAATVLIAGTAAVGGVALANVVSVSAGPVQFGGGLRPWPQVFSLAGNPLGVLAALAFGYAPTRVFDLLRSDQASAAQQLKSSQM